MVRFEHLEDRRLLAANLLGAEGESPLAALGGLPPDQLRFVKAQGIAPFPQQRIEVSSTTQFLTSATPGTARNIALDYLTRQSFRFGFGPDDIANAVITDQYTSSHTGTTHIYLRQMFNGLEVLNANININVAADGSIINVGGGFVGGLTHPSSPSDLQAAVSAPEALTRFASAIGAPVTSPVLVVRNDGGPDQAVLLSPSGVSQSPVPARLVYVPQAPTEGGGVELAWQMEVDQLNTARLFDAYVSAGDGDLLGVDNRVWGASYNVFPLPFESPEDSFGNIPASRRVVVDPQDPIASPLGWHDVNGLPGADFFDTRGNNIFAQEDRDLPLDSLLGVPIGARPAGGPNLAFDSPLTLPADPASYTDAATTNLFYWTNVSHDIHYRYGFDEVSGNFQQFNYTGEGLGQDPLFAYSQVAGELNIPLLMNNAFYVPTVDGTSPQILMFEWDIDISDPLNLTQYAPVRDTDLDNGVIVHEYGHGVSTRLSGGPGTIGLGALQSAGMGEGWSDWWALMFTQKATDTRDMPRAIGDYLMGPNRIPDVGIRRAPYSFDLSIDPRTLGDFNGGFPNNEVHNSGEIWASALWDMNWLLIEKYGYDPDLYTGTGGNNLALRLVMDGLKIQPANPTFTEARDAILIADLVLNQGVNHKEIWTAFARRGFGVSALSDSDLTDAFVGPSAPTVKEAFDLPNNSGFISGQVFRDDNSNGLRDGGEPGLANREVFVDLNKNRRRDPLEPATQTDARGEYTFEFLVRGTFTVAQTLLPGESQTSPRAPGSHTVDVTNGQTVDDVDFGVRIGGLPTQGVKFHDLDGDGRRDANEPGVRDFWIYVDLDDDGRLDLGEPAAVTQADGSYQLSVNREGTFKVREVNMAGWVQTFPGGVDRAHSITVEDTALTVALDFGNLRADDYGDAPDSYRTRVASGGPVHGFLPDFFLGATVDTEADGTPTDNADGDDLDQLSDDEDGVVFLDDFVPGESTDIEITVTTGLNAAGRLNAWMDFNRNGNFDDAGEQIIVGARRGEGTHTFSIPVPADAVPGVSYVRVRYGVERDIGPGGPARAGEVEDYRVRILSDQPQAVPDQFTVRSDDPPTVLDVLANDITSRNGPIFISDVTQPNRGGRVTISAGGTFLTYTPPISFVPVESFTYTIRDQAGVESTTNVVVTILPPTTDPIAVDDSFEVFENSSNNRLDVLANDLTGQNPPIEIIAIPNPPSNGFVTIERNGTPDPRDDFLSYTPNTNFGGTDQFTYTVQDQRSPANGGPVQSGATVTVHVVPGDRNDDLVRFRVDTTDLNGNSIDAIPVNDQFLLQVFITDLRLDDGDGDPIDRRGVAGAYADVLYDLRFVSVAGAITYGPDYQNVKSGNTAVPGLIDEAGAFQTLNNPLGASELLLFSVPMTANAIGTATFEGDPADITPFHDTLLFQPPGPVAVEQQQFVNTPAANATPELVHTLQILGVGGLPVAVDNTFHVPANSSNNVFDVLKNDTENANPPLRIVALGPRSDGGSASITNNGTTITYTPRAGFNGTEQFTYTVQNNVNLQSTATVTVQVGASVKDVNFRVETTDTSGNPISVVNQGSFFQLRVFLEDLRSDDGDGDARDERGVFAAYMDLLYDVVLAGLVPNPANPFGFDISFGSDYDQNGLSANGQVRNIIDEVGAFQTVATPLGANEVLLAVVTFNAKLPGVAEFFVDPADISPLHDTLLFEPTDPVPIDRIDLGLTSITILGAPEGEFVVNPRNRFDVDNNGLVTPRDALLLVNRLNDAQAGLAEGEHGPRYYMDVNGDNKLSPNDVLHVVNELNRRAGTLAEGEAPQVDTGLSGNVLTATPPELPPEAATALVVGPPLLGVDHSRTAALPVPQSPFPLAERAAAAPLPLAQAAAQHDALFADWSPSDPLVDARQPLEVEALLDHDFVVDDVLTRLGKLDQEDND